MLTPRQRWVAAVLTVMTLGFGQWGISLGEGGPVAGPLVAAQVLAVLVLPAAAYFSAVQEWARACGCSAALWGALVLVRIAIGSRRSALELMVGSLLLAFSIPYPIYVQTISCVWAAYPVVWYLSGPATLSALAIQPALGVLLALLALGNENTGRELFSAGQDFARDAWLLYQILLMRLPFRTASALVRQLGPLPGPSPSPETVVKTGAAAVVAVLYSRPDQPEAAAHATHRFLSRLGTILATMPGLERLVANNGIVLVATTHLRKSGAQAHIRAAFKFIKVLHGALGLAESEARVGVDYGPIATVVSAGIHPVAFEATGDAVFGAMRLAKGTAAGIVRISAGLYADRLDLVKRYTDSVRPAPDSAIDLTFKKSPAGVPAPYALPGAVDLASTTSSSVSSRSSSSLGDAAGQIPTPASLIPEAADPLSGTTQTLPNRSSALSPFLLCYRGEYSSLEVPYWDSRQNSHTVLAATMTGLFSVFLGLTVDTSYFLSPAWVPKLVYTLSAVASIGLGRYGLTAAPSSGAQIGPLTVFAGIHLLLYGVLAGVVDVTAMVADNIRPLPLHWMLLPYLTSLPVAWAFPLNCVGAVGLTIEWLLLISLPSRDMAVVGAVVEPFLLGGALAATWWQESKDRLAYIVRARAAVMNDSYSALIPRLMPLWAAEAVLSSPADAFSSKTSHSAVLMYFTVNEPAAWLKGQTSDGIGFRRIYETLENAAAAADLPLLHLGFGAALVYCPILYDDVPVALTRLLKLAAVVAAGCSTPDPAIPFRMGIASGSLVAALMATPTLRFDVFGPGRAAAEGAAANAPVNAIALTRRVAAELRTVPLPPNLSRQGGLLIPTPP